MVPLRLHKICSFLRFVPGRMTGEAATSQEKSDVEDQQG
jgi:hypothetical protein